MPNPTQEANNQLPDLVYLLFIKFLFKSYQESSKLPKEMPTISTQTWLIRKFILH